MCVCSCICLVYVSASGGAPVGTPASRVLLGNVGSVSSSGLSHIPPSSNPNHDECPERKFIPAGTSPGSTRSPT